MDVFSEVFTTTGRLNRRTHFKYQMIWIVLIMLATVTSSLMVEFLTGDPANERANTIGGVLVFIWMIGFFTIHTRRLHDLNLSGLLSILIFVPVLGVFFWLYMFFAAGTVGSNQYGEEPLTD